ncbi:hypothetical protein DFJ74DRAFT_123810 [Hyaloraphidium curvatum]|nr:hypothetical protein DFJ74DRAFT_123810 [Hyaloraphidium curvatum]
MTIRSEDARVCAACIARSAALDVRASRGVLCLGCGLESRTPPAAFHEATRQRCPPARRRPRLPRPPALRDGLRPAARRPPQARPGRVRRRPPDPPPRRGPLRRLGRVAGRAQGAGRGAAVRRRGAAVGGQEQRARAAERGIAFPTHSERCTRVATLLKLRRVEGGDEAKGPAKVALVGTWDGAEVNEKFDGAGISTTEAIRAAQDRALAICGVTGSEGFVEALEIEVTVSRPDVPNVTPG